MNIEYTLVYNVYVYVWTLEKGNIHTEALYIRYIIHTNAVFIYDVPLNFIEHLTYISNVGQWVKGSSWASSVDDFQLEGQELMEIMEDLGVGYNEITNR